MSGSEFIAIIILIVVFIAAMWLLPILIAEILDSENPPKQPIRKPINTSSPAKEHKPLVKDYLELDQEMEEVVGWIGVSEPIDTSEMFEKVADGKEKEVIDEIARQLSLPMDVTVKKVFEEKRNNDGSSRLAEVTVGDIPHYGSSNLKYYPCTITVYPGYNSRPDRFIYVIAHELCHYVLQSLRPRLNDSKKEERQTDLAVIFGGFRSAYKTGWQSSVHGNAGYILDEQDINHISKKYDDILTERKREFENISRDYKNLVEKQHDKLLFIEKCKIVLDHSRDVIQDDLAAVGRCFSSISMKEIDRIIEINNSIASSVKSRTRYRKMNAEEVSLRELMKMLDNITLPDLNDVSILMKYANRYE